MSWIWQMLSLNARGTRWILQPALFSLLREGHSLVRMRASFGHRYHYSCIISRALVGSKEDNMHVKPCRRHARIFLYCHLVDLAISIKHVSYPVYVVVRMRQRLFVYYAWLTQVAIASSFDEIFIQTSYISRRTVPLNTMLKEYIYPNMPTLSVGCM